MPNEAGIADYALRIIAKLWNADGNRIQWLKPAGSEAAGFDWWPGDFRVGVRAAFPDAASCASRLRLSVKTGFLTDLAISDSFAEMLSLMSRFSSTCAWVYPPSASGGTSDDNGG